MTAQHTVDTSPRAQLGERLQEAIRDAITRCEELGHPDQGAPIYTPERACAACSADAVLNLMIGVQIEVAPVPGRHYLDTTTELRGRYVITSDWDLADQAELASHFRMAGPRPAPCAQCAPRCTGCDPKPPETVHAITDGSATTSCCGKTPFELPAWSHRLTLTADQATCKPAERLTTPPNA